MRGLIIYILVAPLVLAFVTVAAHVLIEWAKAFHAEFCALIDNDTTAIGAAYRAAGHALLTFHLEGKERIRINEARREQALDASVSRHPGTPVPAQRPQLSLISGGRDF